MFENLYGCYSFIVLYVTSITIINKNTTILFKNVLLLRQINPVALLGIVHLVGTQNFPIN